MSDHHSQQPASVYAMAREPRGLRGGLMPIQAYHTLAEELREAFPDAEPRQLDSTIAQEIIL